MASVKVAVAPSFWKLKVAAGRSAPEAIEAPAMTEAEMPVMFATAPGKTTTAPGVGGRKVAL